MYRNLRRTSVLIQNVELVHDLVVTEDIVLLLDFRIRTFRMPRLDLQVIILRM